MAAPVSVSIAGIGGTVTFQLDELGADSTVQEVLETALYKIIRKREPGKSDEDARAEARTATENLVPVVNGEDAELTDKVSDGAAVAAAPPVSNG